MWKHPFALSFCVPVPTYGQKNQKMLGKVLLTGATGFVGAHVLDILLRHQFPVIVTVRKMEQSEFFKSKYPDAPLAFVQVSDIWQTNALDLIFKLNSDIEYVIHLATPSWTRVRDKDSELFEPVIRGSQNVISAVGKHGHNVRTVVIGSCFAAMMNDPPRFNDPEKIYTARDLNRITREQARVDDYHAYIGCKVFAEDAAWKKYSNLWDPKFALVVIATPLIFGPFINDMALNSLNHSLRYAYEFICSRTQQQLGHHHMDVCTDNKGFQSLPLPFYIDVRDAALAFVKTIQLIPPQTTRWFVAANNVTSQQILDITREHIPHLRNRLPVGLAGSGEEEIKQQCKFDISDFEDSINIQFHSLKDTVIDMYNKILEAENDLGLSIDNLRI